MKKIIVVYGNSNTGKTTVINDVYNYLINNGATMILNRNQFGGDPNDFKAVISYKNKTVAFMSMGDYRTVVDEYVRKFSKYDVLITALNTKFANISTDWLNNSDIIYKVGKTIANNTDNQNVMNSVMTKI